MVNSQALPSDQPLFGARFTKKNTGVLLFFFRQLRQLRETRQQIFEEVQNLQAG